MWEAYLIDKPLFQAGVFIHNFKLNGNALLPRSWYVVYWISQHKIAANTGVVFLQVTTMYFTMILFDSTVVTKVVDGYGWFKIWLMEHLGFI